MHIVIRCHSSTLTSNKKKSSGVLLAIHKDIKYSLIPLVSNSFECICAKMYINGFSFLIVLEYVPPYSSAIASNYHSDLIECISNSLEKYVKKDDLESIFMLGDFNVPGFHWIKEFTSSTDVGDHFNTEVRLVATYYSIFCSNYNLIQYKTFKNKTYTFSNDTTIAIVWSFP